MLIKSLKITLLLLVAGVGCTHSQPVFAPSNTANGYEYKIEITKAAIGVSNSVEHFRIFWHFGDEQYHLSPILSFPNTNMISHTVIHNPPAGASNMNNVYAEITPLTYTDTAEPDRKPLNVISSVFPCATCPATVVPPNNQVDLLFNRNLVKGHRVTLIVPYRRCGPVENSTGNENITLYYAADQIELENSNTLIHGAGIVGAVPAPQQISGTTVKKLRFAVDPQLSTQYLYIPMEVSDNLNPPQAMDIRLTYNFEALCKGEGEAEQDTGVINTGAMLAFSHDPNSLESPAVFICDCETQDTVRYVVKFQNVGMAPADTVIIKDIIPEAYDINSINLQYPKVGNTLPPKNINTSTREVTWTLTGDFLKGTADLLGTASGALEEFTIDSLVFGIKIADCDSIKSCDVIFNQAEIIFDCNPSIYTNPHMVRFGCKGLSPFAAGKETDVIPQDSCTCNEIVFPSDTIFLSAGDSTTSFTNIPQVNNLLNNYNAVHRWYPTYDVLNPSDPDSKIFTPKTRSFFQVASTAAPDIDFDCYRMIKETVVQIDCPFDQIEYELTCDQQTGKKDLRAWVPGNTQPLQWRGNPCQTALEFNAYDVPGTELRLMAVDPATNCAIEKLADLTDCPKRKCCFRRWIQRVFLRDKQKVSTL